MLNNTLNVLIHNLRDVVITRNFANLDVWIGYKNVKLGFYREFPIHVLRWRSDGKDVFCVTSFRAHLYYVSTYFSNESYLVIILTPSFMLSTISSFSYPPKNVLTLFDT